MFPITRLAIKATKIERNVAKTLAKGTKTYGTERAQDFQTIIKKAGLVGIKPYSKNPFKRMYAWVKSFFEYYAGIKKSIKNTTKSLKEEYGKLFTKKRQKIAKHTVIKRTKELLNNLKESINEVKLQIKAMANKKAQATKK